MSAYALITSHYGAINFVKHDIGLHLNEAFMNIDTVRLFIYSYKKKIHWLYKYDEKILDVQ